MPKAKFLLSLLAIGCVTPSVVSSASEPLQNWSTATALPKRVPQQMNILRLDGDRLLWNGKEVSETHLLQFLRMIAEEMNPQPLTVLTYSRPTPRGHIQRARLLVHNVIQCTPGECLEVTTPPA
jgi:hypothetical protein